LSAPTSPMPCHSPWFPAWGTGIWAVWMCRCCWICCWARCPVSRWAAILPHECPSAACAHYSPPCWYWSAENLSLP